MLHQLHLWVGCSSESTTVNISANEWSVPITSANAISWQSKQFRPHITAHGNRKGHSGGVQPIPEKCITDHLQGANPSFQRHISDSLSQGELWMFRGQRIMSTLYMLKGRKLESWQLLNTDIFYGQLHFERKTQKMSILKFEKRIVASNSKYFLQ